MTVSWRMLGAVLLVAAIAGYLVTRATAPPAAEDWEEIDRELRALVETLRLDETIETAVLPPALPSADVPVASTLPYRRPVDFWQSAFDEAAKGQP